MSNGEPKMPTPEEMAKFEEQRMLSDAKLVEGGANVKVDKKGNRINLIPTEKQIDEIENDAAIEKRLSSPSPECYSEELKEIIEKNGGLDSLMIKLSRDEVFAGNFYKYELQRIIKTKNTDEVINDFKKNIAEALRHESFETLYKYRIKLAYSKEWHGQERSGAASSASNLADRASVLANLINKLLTEAGEKEKGENMKKMIDNELERIRKNIEEKYAPNKSFA